MYFLETHMKCTKFNICLLDSSKENRCLYMFGFYTQKVELINTLFLSQTFLC